MKNCTLAALNLPQNPHDEKNGLLNIVLSYKDDWASRPSHKRFTVELVALPRRSDAGKFPDGMVQTVVRTLDSPPMAAAVARGEIEYGNNFYGTSIYMVMGSFRLPNSEEPLGVALFQKAFSISKEAARARTNPLWEMLFRDIVLKGTKMRFCCGKIESDVPGSSEQTCCCGGWTHNLKDIVRQLIVALRVTRNSFIWFT